MDAQPKFFLRLRSLWFGMSLPWHAVKLILQNKGLLFWSLIPMGLTLVLYFYLVQFLQHWAQGQLDVLFTQWGWNPEGWLAFFMVVITKLLLILVSVLTFTFSSSIVASPFNDLLAEKAEAFAQPPLPEVREKGFNRQMRLMMIDLLKAIASTGAGVLTLLLCWIPVVNVICFGIALLLVTFQYTSYPQTRRGVPLTDGAGFLWRHLWACGGLGATISFLFTIPILSSAALPVAVVSGTLLVARAQKSSEFWTLK